MMKRVCSRQRLVSWDAFDASRHSDLSDSSEYSDNDGLVPLTMDKRKRGRKHLGPVLIPDTRELDELNEDVQVQIISFLDVACLRAMSCVNHFYRSLILCDEAVQTIWKPHLQRHWHMSSSGGDTRMSLVDIYALPLAVGAGVNIPLLLAMTPSAIPTHVDEALLDHPARGSLFRRDRITHQLVRAPMPTKLAVVHQDSSTLIRYTGPVGSGDRCVRANHPLPRPVRRKGTWTSGMKSRPESILERICQGARAVSRRGSDWRPFCAPHRRPDGSMDVTPRMIAYYEVDILEQPATTTPESNYDPFSRIVRTHSTECVAVGIATESFHIHTRMPGWDALSFGYHGDDGGIFHSSGGMIERFGPTFGRGDTVGCGIDYVGQAIFFTLNGKFLGYGWKNIGVEFLNNDLYPVVGIDTNALIELNFGITKPFQFDLTSFHQQHSKLIEPQYRFHHQRRGFGIKMPSSRSIGSASSGSSRNSSKR